MRQHDIRVHPIMDAMSKLDTVRVNEEDYVAIQRVHRRQRIKWVSNFMGLLAVLLATINSVILLILIAAIKLFDMNVINAVIIVGLFFTASLGVSVICIWYSRSTFDRCSAILSNTECVAAIKRVAGKQFSKERIIEPLYELVESKPWDINAFDLYNAKDTATHSISWSTDGNSDISVWKK